MGIYYLSHRIGSQTSFLTRRKLARGLLYLPDMQPINFIALLEEMIDVKVQQQAQSQLKVSPEIAMVLAQKRDTDKRRLDQIRAELVRILTA